MKVESRRTKKVSSELLMELAQILNQEASDPLLRSLTLTEIQVSPDLKNARVFYTHHLNDPKLEPIIKKSFEKAAPFLKKKLSENGSLRYIPKLVFEKDVHLDEVNRLNQLLEQL